MSLYSSVNSEPYRSNVVALVLRDQLVSAGECGERGGRGEHSERG